MAAAVGDQRRKKEAMELLVTEIAKGEEDRIAPQLRTVIERGWLDSFPTILNEAKKKKDAEIDRICSRHYGDFLNSVNEMLNMENNIKTLKASVVNVHEKFTSKGGDLVQVLESLSRIQHEREHTRKALEATMLCKDVAMLMVQAKKEIEEDDYYAAMRTVENIKSHLTNPDLQPLVKTLEVWLPMTVNKLLYGVRSEADLFITQLRQSTGLLGNTVLLRQARLSANLEANLRNGSGSGSVTTASSNFGNTRRPTVLTPVKTLPGIMMAGAAVGGGGGGGNDFSLLPAQVTISLKYLLSNPAAFYLDNQYCKPLQFDVFLSTHFKGTIGVIKEGAELLDQRLSELPALHKAYHLYAVLGQGATFLEHYNDLRDHHFKQILKQFEVEINRSSNPNGLMGCIPRFLDQIVGFFTLECIFYRVLNQTVVGYSIGSGSNGNGGEVEDSLKEYWKQALTSLQHVLDNLGITLTSPDELIQVKEEMILLLHTASDDLYALDCSLLVQMIIDLFEIFEGLQIQFLTRQAILALEKCAYQPFFVSSQEIYSKQIKPYQLDRIEIDHEVFLNQSNGGNGNNATMSTSGIGGGGGGGGGGGSQQMGRRGSSMTSFSEGSSSSRSATGMEMKSGSTGSTNNGVGSNESIERKGQQQRILMQHLDANLDALEEEIGLHAPICQELHAALIRTLLYLFIKPPDSLLVLLHNINPAITVAAAAANNRTKSTTLTASSSSSSSSSSAFLAAGYDSSSSLLTISEGRRQASERLVMILSHTNFVHLAAQAMAAYYKTLTDLLQKELKKDGLETALSKACQISIDAVTLALSCEYLWKILESALQHCFGIQAFQGNTNNTNGGGVVVPLSPMNNVSSAKGNTTQQNATSTTTTTGGAVKLGQIYDSIIINLRSLISQAQDLIFELLSNKIDGLLESLVFIDYEPATLMMNIHQGVNLNAMNSQYVHECIESMVEFLSITFMWLTHLPQTIRESIHFISCSKVSVGILSYLLDKVLRINIFGFIALDADVKRLIQFADSCGTTHLRSCFEELSQTIRLFLHPELPTVIDNITMRKQLFPLTSSLKLATIVDKISPSPVVALSSNLPRLEKNMTRTWAKKLRAQAQKEE
eukprot:gene3461-3790_t